MSIPTPSISLERIMKYLPEEFDQNKIQIFDVLDSTNNQGKRLAMAGGADGTIVVAQKQTAGRGRVGRSFFSPEDGGVYFTILLRTTLSMDENLLITGATAVAVADAINKVCGVYPSIKWVNDLYLDGKKVCGILAEMVTNPTSGKVEALVIGVGLNCNAVFPEELCEIAGNLPYVPDIKNRLIAELSVRLSRLESMVQQGEFLNSYREHSMVIGQWITLPSEPESRYYVRQIGNHGELILEDEDGLRRVLATGEISIRPWKQN